MDRRLLRYYDRELRHLQTVAREFAREFPKIAGRLALEDFPCVDPYVERLLEGFAFLAARVQLKLDAEFPRFTQNLLETVYPHYLAPTPSMAVVRFNHDPQEAGLADGCLLPRGTVLISGTSASSTPCEYRTAQSVTLWPLVVSEARYYTRDAGALELHRVWGKDELAPGQKGVRAALRLRVKSTANLPLNKVEVKDLRLFLAGGDATPFRLYEQLLSRVRRVIVRPVPVGLKSGAWQEELSPSGEAMSVKRVGFSQSEALLPYDARSFQGYRLLHEYFAFPQRYLFVEVGDVSRAFAKCKETQADIILVLNDESVELEGAVSAENFLTNCVPAINLFPKRADRIFVQDRANEFQVIGDRTKPLDFEVYRVSGVTGYSIDGGTPRTFKPFYAASDDSAGEGAQAAAYYSVARMPRATTEKERLQGPRSSYAGSEVYLSLVDASCAPYSPDIRQLAVETMCTNRDLPLQMPVGKGKTDFTLQVAAPVTSVRVVAGPTAPRPSHAEGETAWRLVSHLALNYLSLSDEDVDGDGMVRSGERHGAAALRELLKLYGDVGDPVIRKQIEGVRHVVTEPITRRVPTPGVVAFARGLEVTVTFDEQLFEGTGAFVLGAVLDQFFARYVSTNSFTETVVRTADRGEIMRWKATPGHRPTL